MSDCCTPGRNPASRKRACPNSGHLCAPVPPSTVLHHVRSPWRLQLQEQTFYFCEDPACDVVYFGDDGATIGSAELRTRVGIKSRSSDASLCYCFGVTYGDAQADPRCETFVREQTRRSACACSTRNPSGRCCLKDFPHTQAV